MRTFRILVTVNLNTNVMPQAILGTWGFDERASRLGVAMDRAVTKVLDQSPAVKAGVLRGTTRLTAVLVSA